MISALTKILGNSSKTVTNWKKEKRPIIDLIYKYFKKEELEEFLDTGKIQKQELIKDFTNEEIEALIKNKHNADILAQIEELKSQLK